MIQKSVSRMDFGTLRRSERTDEGFLFFEAIATRSGVFEYMNADGSIRREYRSPDEVAHVDSLATLGRKPLTLDHPADATGNVLLTPANAEQYSKGAIGEHIEVLDAAPDLTSQRGKFVRVTGSIYSQDAIEAVTEQGIEEVSCGYTCDLVMQPGVTPEGEKYDARQTNIRYNHLALVERGRAGHAARLRVDSHDAIQHHTTPQGKPTMAKHKKYTKTRRMDSVLVNQDQADLYSAVRSDMEQMDEEIAEQEEKMVGLDEKMQDLMKKADEYEQKHGDMEKMLADAAEKMASYDEGFEKLKALLGGMMPPMEEGEEVEDELDLDKMDKADVPKAIALIKARQDAAFHKRFQERTALEKVARALKVDCKDVSDRDLRLAILKADKQEVDPKAPTSYLQGRIDEMARRLEDDAYLKAGAQIVEGRKTGDGALSGRDAYLESIRKAGN